MAADVVLSVVETDLRLLAAEAKKAEGPMTNLMGILHHSDLPAVKDATERALQKVRTVEQSGLSGVQQALEILAPFALACETKYAKLACIAISAFQKLLANDAVSIKGRCEIINALQAAERLSDESVKLRILQASLTIIQSPSFADEQDAIQQLLSLLFRLYVNNKSNVAVHSTAAATIRQAVALVFDHSAVPGRVPGTTALTMGSPAVGYSPRPSLSTPSRSGCSGGGANSPGPPQPGGAGGGASAAQPVSATAVIAGAVMDADAGAAPGREVVPVLLLEEIMGWLGAREGKELGWVQLQQRSGNRIDRTFLLEMLEAVLLQRWVAIHRLPGLVQCMKAKVAPAIHGLLDSACDRLVDPNDAVDCRLVVRCSAAFIRRHHNLAPERAAAMVVRLAETAGSVGRSAAAHRWQRFMALQALRSLLADPSLLYRLYHLQLPADKQPPGTATMAASTAGKSMEANGSVAASPVADGGTAGGSGSVVHIIVASLYDALRWYVRTSIETPEDDVVAALGNLYFQRAMGARDAVQETEAFGTNLAHGSEVVIAHLALECVLAMVAATEALTDVVVVPAEPGMPSPKLITRDTPEVRCADVAGLVLELWRCVLNVCNTLLARAGHDVLVGLLVRGMQGVTYSAGALGVVEARDALLHALCAHTLLPPGEDDVAALAVSMAGGSGGAAGGQCAEDRSVGGTSRRNLAIVPVIGSSSSSTHAGDGGASSAPGFLTALLVDRSASSVRVVLTPRNIAALRALFNIAHRLADGLGSCGWLYVVDAVNALDRILASPHTTTAAYLVETGGEGEVVTGLQPMNSSVVPISGAPTAVGAGVGTGGAAAAAAAGVGPAASAAGAASAVTPDGVADDGSTAAQRELRILASAADQLFENTHHMSPEAVVSLLSALADISHRTLAGLGLLGGGSAAGGIVAAAAAAAPPPLPSAAAVAVVAVASTGPGGGGVLSPSVGVAAAAAVVPGAVRLCALNRMVDTLLHNLWRVQDLWGIFLAHVLEALASNNMQVRAAAVDALDRTITGALNPDLHVPDKFTAPLPALEDALSPAAAVAARKALLPNFPSYATTAIPSPAGGAIGTSTPGSRRSSKDMAFGLGAAVGMTTPISSPQVSLHPSTGRGISGGGAGTGAATSVPLATFTVAASPTFQSPTLPRYASGGGGATPAFAMGRHSSDLSNHLPPLPTGPPPPHPSSLASAASPAAASSSPFARSLTTATIAAVTTTTTTTTAAAAAAAIGTPGSNAATIAAASPSPGTAPPVTNRGVQQSAQREDVQHMLLVALDSLYREGGRSPDVRHGLLRIALHVLQHHGDGLTRGWVPLLRLLDAVPRAGQGSADVRLGFQVVELLATDYLASSLPKEHVAKALEVIAKFATQDTVLNVSLSSITMLWNVTDHLARSRGTFSKAAATQHQQGHHHHQQQQQQKHPHPVAMMTVNAVAAAASPTPAAATVGTPPPRAPTTQLGSSSSTRPIGGGSSGAAAAGSSPFSSEMYGSDTAGDGEKQMSPAFAAALSFARGVPSLPSASSPERSPWVQQQQPQARPDAQLQQGQPVHQQAHLGQAAGALAAIVAGGAGGAGYPMHDLDEAESIAMLMIAFRSLKALSVDPRPEARNAAVRTLFLAVGSHGGKFPSATWHELFWSLLFDLLLTIHRVSSTSSVEEAAAVELGKEKGGRPVVMLVHHSRNSEQKQWDETLVLALGGAAKVMRSYMAVLSGLDVWTTAWEQLMQLLGELLATGRKAVCLASTSLLTTVLQAHGSGPLVSRAMWQQTLAALDRGVNAMAAPNTSAPLQARAELLTCITTISSQLLLLRSTRSGTSAAVAGGTVVLSSSNGIDEGGVGAIAPVATNPDPEQLLLILRWLDRFARYPVGADDTSSIHFTTIGPIQKSAMAVMAALPPAVSAAGVWPAVLAVLCNMLRPFSTLALRQYAQLVAALLQQRKANSPAPWSSSSTPESSSHPATSGAPITASTGAASGAGALDSMASYTSAGSSREPSVHGQAAGSSSPIAPVPAVAGGVSSGLSSAGSGSSSPWLTFATSREVMEARALSPLWMARVVELLAAWYRDQVSWQVRVATFPLLVGAMSECMACRHLLPQHQPQSGSQHPEGPQAQLILAGDLGEVQALEELWRAAARGFVTVVQTGLPSINICSHQGQQPQQVLVPHSTWPALARAFQMFFLATNLPPLQQPPQEAQHALSLALAAAGGSSATASYFRRMSTCSEPVVAMGGTVLPPPSPEQIAADFEITMAVLDCLSETVLGSCQHAPIEMRRALMEVLDMGAASAAAPSAAGISSCVRPYDESGLPPTSRLSHICLNKLYVLCSRGQDAPVVLPEQDGRDVVQQPAAASRSQFEVSQLALPVFVTRCEAILQEYARAEQRFKAASILARPGTPSGRAASLDFVDSGTASGGPIDGPATAPAQTLSPLRPGLAGAVVPVTLHDKARHVLELLQQLRVVPPVSDSLLPSRPHLRFWLDVMRAVRCHAAMPPPSLAAGAAAAAAASTTPGLALHSCSSLGGSGGAPGGLMLSPLEVSRRSSSGFELASPTAAAVATAAGSCGGAGGSTTAAETVASSGAPTGRSAASSFFSRTYSSTGALLSSAIGAATGGSTTVSAAPPTPPKRPSGSGGGGGGGGGTAALQPLEARTSSLAPPRHLATAFVASGATGSGLGSLQLTGKSLWVKEQPHLPALYGVLCESIGSSDPAVRSAVQGMLAALGGGLGMCATPQPMSPFL